MFDGDRNVLSTVGNQTYEELSRIFQRWVNESDPPVRRSDHCCYITSKRDAWNHMVRFITHDDLERFKNAAMLVLSTPDPKFDLPQEQRWMASAIGHRPPYSEWLKHGIADTLALMGACNATPSGGLSAIHFNAIAEELVRRLFMEAANNWGIWASISDLLPLLAEAAPDVYLSAVERELDGESPPILQLFADQRDALMSSSPHTGLLWSLETLSWSSEYLGRSGVILARLSCLDPGGKLANRPISSLHEIFCLWLPQTAAHPEHRLTVIDTIRARSPKVAWDLLLGLIPVPYQHVSPTSKPVWRSWPNGARGRVSPEELGQQVAQIVSRLVSDVGSEGDRWKGLLKILPSIPLGYELIEKKLIEMDIKSLSVPHQMTIWAQLRKLVSDHRTFADAPWALPSDRVCVLEEVCLRLVPSHPISKYEWFFSYNPEFLEGQPDDPDQRKQLARKAREHALGEVYASMGFAGLKELINVVDLPHEVGISASENNLLGEDEDSFRISLNNNGRCKMGDYEIGKMLARSPYGANDVWPHPIICEIVQTLQNEVVDAGFKDAVHNSRGVVSKGVYDGGVQERELSEGFLHRASRLDAEWPRVAALLRDISKGYASQAEREDSRVDILEDTGQL